MVVVSLFKYYLSKENGLNLALSLCSFTVTLTWHGNIVNWHGHLCLKPPKKSGVFHTGKRKVAGAFADYICVRTFQGNCGLYFLTSPSNFWCSWRLCRSARRRKVVVPWCFNVEADGLVPLFCVYEIHNWLNSCLTLKLERTITIQKGYLSLWLVLGF